MIDTHAHLNFKAFKKEYAELIERSFLAGVKEIINVGSNLATSQRAVEITEEFYGSDPSEFVTVGAKGSDPAGRQQSAVSWQLPARSKPSRKLKGSDPCKMGVGLYAAVGLHPIHVQDEEFKIEKFRELAKNPQVVAIGETGLDYYHIAEKRFDLDPAISPKRSNLLLFKNLQQEVFIKHLELAKELNLPVILHCRGSKENPKDAYEEILLIINHLSFNPCGVIHCFSANWPIVQQFLKLGFYIGFTGPITFKNATPELLEVVKRTPIDRILTETDCPFLAPEPHRGERNEPAFVQFIAEKIAQIKRLSLEEVDKVTTRNAKKLFGL